MFTSGFSSLFKLFSYQYQTYESTRSFCDEKRKNRSLPETYAIFAILWSVIVIVSMMISERMPNQGFIIPLLQFTLSTLVMIGVIAVVVLGWLVILAGATAGWLLFKIRPLLSKPCTMGGIE
jgi:hypothetical protein